jgi:PTH1 family peptidyl-tRNA hydrolase
MMQPETPPIPQPPALPITLIVGLGNPGPAYAGSRHNVGFRCVEQLARKNGIRLGNRNRHVVFGEGRVADAAIVVAKPRTFVNLSGAAVRYLIDRYRVAPAALLVVYDDMDLPLGRLRIRALGSSGGHNGISSIIETLGTQEFPRLRVGIGRPWDGDAVPHVLGRFTDDEAKLMETAVEAAVDAMTWAVQDGVESAMNRVNQRASANHGQ